MRDLVHAPTKRAHSTVDAAQAFTERFGGELLTLDEPHRRR